MSLLSIFIIKLTLNLLIIHKHFDYKLRSLFNLISTYAIWSSFRYATWFSIVQ